MKHNDSNNKQLLAMALSALMSMAIFCTGALADSAEQPADYQSEQTTDTSDYLYSYDGMTVSYVEGDMLSTQDGQPALVVYYDFTNEKTNAEAFIYSFSVTVYQDGIECDPAYTWDFESVPEDAYTSLVSIKDGATMRVAKYFRLKNDTSPVDVEVSRMFSFGARPMAITLALPDVTVSSSSVSVDDVQEISIEFTNDDAESIAAAALLEGKSPSRWLHDIAIAAISDSESEP